MKLAEQKLNDFLEICASSAPAPGGGSASALCGSIGAALFDMVAKLTSGKKKYAEYQEDIELVIKESEILYKQLLVVMDKDTEAYGMVTQVFSMPKATDAEKEKRKDAMETALKECTKMPHQTMILALQALVLGEKLLGKSNINAASDLAVGALTLKTALQGAWLNILINIDSIKDREFAEKYKTSGREILSNGLAIADRIYNAVEIKLTGSEQQC